jgi:transcriptional regulator
MRRDGVKNGVRIKQILQLQKQGKNQSQIARELGITRQAISAHLKKYAQAKNKPKKKQKNNKPTVKRKIPINWSVYNEALVKRGEFILPLELLSIEEELLQEMNQGKKRGYFKYSDALIQLCSIIRIALKLDYRTNEGMCKKLFDLFNVKTPDFTTVWRREEKLPIELSTFMKNKEVEIAVDGTGRSQNIRGSYRESQYETKPRKFVKFIVSVNTKTKEVIVTKVVDEDTSEAVAGKECIKESIKQSDGKVKSMFADRLYDDKKVRAQLIKNDVLPVIPPKIKANQTSDKIHEKLKIIKNKLANYHEKDDYFYSELAEAQRLLDMLKITGSYENWRNEKSYSKRNAVENFFSRDTLFFGDTVASKKISKARKELLLRCKLLNIFIVIGKAKSKQDLLNITAVMKQRLVEGMKTAITNKINGMT